MNHNTHTLATVATAIITAIFVLNATVGAQAAPSTPTAQAAPHKPVTPQVGGLSRRVIELPDFQRRDDDRAPGLLGVSASDDLKYPHDVCYGMITCCNSAWVQGCNPEYFEDVCTIYGGEVVLNPFSDGSINYECHQAD